MQTPTFLNADFWQWVFCIYLLLITYYFNACSCNIIHEHNITNHENKYSHLPHYRCSPVDHIV